MSVPFASYLPMVSLLAGLGGGLHCVGMCGGLVTASCSSSKDIWGYQLGRLTGYLLLALLAAQFGTLLKFAEEKSWVTSILLGLTFIYWGLESYRGKRAELPVPKFLARFYGWGWRKSLRPQQRLRSTIVGLFSIFLPCGLLYGVVLGAVALQGPSQALMAIFFFWLGTLPSMLLAPDLVRRVLGPLRAKLPRAYAIGLISLGLITIGIRAQHWLHQAPGTVQSQSSGHHCH